MTWKQTEINRIRTKIELCLSLFKAGRLGLVQACAAQGLRRTAVTVAMPIKPKLCSPFMQTYKDKPKLQTIKITTFWAWWFSCIGLARVTQKLYEPWMTPGGGRREAAVSKWCTMSLPLHLTLRMIIKVTHVPCRLTLETGGWLIAGDLLQGRMNTP